MPRHPGLNGFIPVRCSWPSGGLAETDDWLYGLVLKFRVLVEADEDGVFVAECPTLPGCISQGETREAAVQNIKDAIAGYLASLEKHGEAGPLPFR